ncbi:isocitrate lyase/PEP mutase family protein [Flexivirga caeni]|uniref:Isocitrate lyase/phosphoenolpyruvate mutase family protein n=1 Tax=Flexivirga caeni TaxID=2294115 RepID=A0A3M9M7Z4_9MICO|nr:isocitrate lyase/phosphoenolpyruvate mutase family protein [Flexivirga caeni]RNI21661.1 isocitrate lyase/phosphoenolpyruvate mutase family protein [Flexivirga caeni]
MTTIQERAAHFTALHDDLLVLPNCWDAGSAAVIEATGAPALATSSAAVAWALGRPDGNQLDRDTMLDALRRICAVATVPVSCDIESGFASDDADLAETIAQVIETGVVGVNLEDQVDGTLLPIGDAARRVRVVREAATRAGVDAFYLNARTDSYLLGRADFADTVARAHAYLDAGASGIFVPGTADPEVVKRLTAAIPAPVNVLAGPGAPSVACLRAAGARRISAGSSLAGAILGHLRRATQQLLTDGTYDELAGGMSWAELNALFEQSPPSP